VITRRRFGALSCGALASLALGAACRREGDTALAADGRLTARPIANVRTSVSGKTRLGLDPSRDASLQIPATASTAPLALLILLHGAGGSGEDILDWLGPVTEEAGLAVLAPDSRDSSWDAVRYNFGADVGFLNRALQRVFDTVSVDPERIAIGGFSDGATYAVSLGLINGDLFRRVLAFSPGFVIDGPSNGKPQFFISHGTADKILPIDRCGRQVSAGLRKRGYNVTFREFEGGHSIPSDIALDGMRWVAGLPAA